MGGRARRGVPFWPALFFVCIEGKIVVMKHLFFFFFPVIVVKSNCPVLAYFCKCVAFLYGVDIWPKYFGALLLTQYKCFRETEYEISISRARNVR